MSGLSLLLDSSRGVFVPQAFAECYDVADWGLDPASENVKILVDGPDTDWYWEAWESVLGEAQHTDKKGNVWTLHQDGDLWAVCLELMDDEEYENFFGEER